MQHCIAVGWLHSIALQAHGHMHIVDSRACFAGAAAGAAATALHVVRRCAGIARHSISIGCMCMHKQVCAGACEPQTAFAGALPLVQQWLQVGCEAAPGCGQVHSCMHWIIAALPSSCKFARFYDGGQELAADERSSSAWGGIARDKLQHDSGHGKLSTSMQEGGRLCGTPSLACMLVPCPFTSTAGSWLVWVCAQPR
ncbi:hypothetical protein COO60DRAFT_774167 [Scenedesmus sp. NREL 46B-D3]|nr:hypothetical protein COO60DRAFT_774167 [Scenedesmus sp. NREL 46B-D3]